MTLPIENSQISHTTAEWQSLNPVLALDVIGIEIMSNGYNRYKRGDGATAWSVLSYIDKPYGTDKQDSTEVLTAGSTLSDSDKFPFYDVSASSNLSILWSTIKSTLKSYFDSIYAPVISKMQSVIGINKTSAQTLSAVDTLLTFNSTLIENDPLSILSLYNNGIKFGEAGLVKIWGAVHFTPNSGSPVADAPHIMLYKNGVSTNVYCRSFIYKTAYLHIPFYEYIMNVAANDYIQFHIYVPYAGVTGSGLEVRMYAQYIS